MTDSKHCQNPSLSEIMGSEEKGLKGLDEVANQEEPPKKEREEVRVLMEMLAYRIFVCGGEMEQKEKRRVRTMQPPLPDPNPLTMADEILVVEL